MEVFLMKIGSTDRPLRSYVHHIDDMDPEDSQRLIEKLLAHVSKPKYRVTIPWEAELDLIIWDNTAAMHRATGGSYEGKYRRDMRRTTVKDMSSYRFGLNGEGADWRVGLP
jgi:alpha-ketoglutarate-dependent 2,4-dichlorophenoxyacetate dioxygenase